MPGGVLGLRALTVGRLETGAAHEQLVLFCLLAGTLFLLLGVLRFLGTCREEPGAPVPAPLLGAFGAQVLAMVNPFSLDLWGGGAVSPGGPRFSWILLVPIAGALLAHALASPPEGIARLWSGVRPSRDRALLSLTGHRAGTMVFGGLSVAVRGCDRALFWLFGVLWSIVRAAGRAARLVERSMGAVAAAAALWRFVA
jgi:hypothetical protein